MSRFNGIALIFAYGYYAWTVNATKIWRVVNWRMCA